MLLCILLCSTVAIFLRAFKCGNGGFVVSPFIDRDDGAFVFGYILNYKHYHYIY